MSTIRRCLALGALLSLLSASGARRMGPVTPQDESDRSTTLRLSIDGTPDDYDDSLKTVDTQNVPLGKILDSFFGKSVQMKERSEKSGKHAHITYDGKLWIDLTVDSTDPVALIYDPEKSQAKPEAVVNLNVGPFHQNGKLLVDLEEFASLVASSVSESLSDSIEVRTCRWWEQQLGLKNQGAPHVEFLRDFGVSPAVGNTIRTFVRAKKQCFVQIYSLQYADPEPVIVKVGSEYVARKGGRAAGAMKPMMPGELWSLLATYTNLSSRSVARFALLVTETDAGNDPIAAINSGTYKGRWLATGIENIVDPNTPLQYATIQGTGESVEKFLAKMPVGTDPDTFRGINGMAEGEIVREGQTYVYLKGVEAAAEKEPESYRIVGPHVVRREELPLDALAKKWGVSTKDVLQANQDYFAGSDMEQPLPGDIITRIAPISAAAKPEPTDARYESGTATAHRKVLLSPTPDRTETLQKDGVDVIVPAGAKVPVKMRSNDGKCLQVEYEGVSGWALASEFEAKTKPVDDGFISVAAPRSPKIQDMISYGLKFVGKVPYHLSGNHLDSRGIDCSNFVATLFHHTFGASAPAPVSSQKDYGQIIHNNLRAVQVGSSGNPRNPQKADWALLRPGDRFIMMNRPRGPKDVPNHTGIYLGEYFRKPDGTLVRHAILHSKGHVGVTIGTLDTNYYRNIYQYSVRDFIQGTTLHPIRRQKT